MKTIITAGCSLLLSACLCEAVLVTYSFNLSNGDETSFPADVQPTGGTVSEMTRGSGLTPVSAGGSFNSSGWTLDGARDTSDYYTFTITPSANYLMTLTRLELDERRSGTGIRNWQIYSSMDNYVTALGTFSVLDDTSTRVDQGVNLVAFTGLSSPISFRIYGYNAEAAGGTWRIDNVELSGSLTAVPEASTWVAGLGLSLGMLGTYLRKYRK